MELNLIFDRTQGDADRIDQLQKKAWDDFTDAEKEFFWTGDPALQNGVVKGAYNAEDFVRVDTAAFVLLNVLTEAGYAVDVVPSEWEEGSEPPREKLERYLQNIRNIRSAMFVETPLPEEMRGLTVSEANAIEKVLWEANRRFERAQQSVDLGWAMGVAHTGLYGGVG